MFSRAELEDATGIVRQSFAPTPQIAWPLLKERSGAEVWVKHENHLPTSAFKVRGGLVLADALKKGRYGKVPRGIITATVGNHGLSQTYAGRKAGFAVTIVVPENNNPEKNKALKALGAELIEAGHDYSAAYDSAARIARERDLFVIEPFLPELMRGVATYALEFFTALPDLDTVYVPIGMGSGICGLIRTRDLLQLKTRIVGVVAENAPAHALSFKAGQVVTTNSAGTFADGVAVRVPKPEPVAIIHKGADRIVTVSDEEIADAIRFYHEDTHNTAEGAGAVPLAGLLQERERMKGKKVGVILTGANIYRPLLARILAQ
ncbi:threonine dehydratase [Taklimakanibacter deserti]|uniref:threonine dehydratase n=1 Tax=Taklimakanibacter deserti TaxID=2267839 RepID=UPI003F686494